MNKTDAVEKYGQVFTPKDTAKLMIGLKKAHGRVLEPSVGDGAFFSLLEKSKRVGIEIDSTICPDGCLNMDFFDYSISEKFDTIIGNPPYVAYKHILNETKSKIDMRIFDERSNLYQFFISKCLCHLKPGGELIFITPREFIKATSSRNLNEILHKLGTITHFYDLGDEKVFSGAQPNSCIWRYEKDYFSRSTDMGDGISKNFTVINGQIVFTNKQHTIDLCDVFDVRVGAASGADEIFTHLDGNKEFVFSETISTRKTRRMFFNVEHPHLEKHKTELKSRKIKKFTEQNWYNWGRSHYDSDKPRIYVNCKTRVKDPFFLHSCKNYDGSVLALFPKIKLQKKDLKRLCKKLNKLNWDELGFVCGGRFMFTQRSLQQIRLPNHFKEFKKVREKVAAQKIILQNKESITSITSMVKDAIQRIEKRNESFDLMDVINEIQKNNQQEMGCYDDVYDLVDQNISKNYSRKEIAGFYINSNKEPNVLFVYASKLSGDYIEKCNCNTNCVTADKRLNVSVGDFELAQGDFLYLNQHSNHISLSRKSDDNSKPLKVEDERVRINPIDLRETFGIVTKEYNARINCENIIITPAWPYFCR